MFKNILVGVDFSNISDAVVESTAFIAKLFGAKVNLITVIEPPIPSFIGSDIDGTLEAEELEILLEIEKTLEKEANEKLEQYVKRLQKEGIQAQKFVEVGLIVDTILDKLKEIRADLLVIGGHKEGLIDKILLGSTANKLVNKSPVSTLVVKGKKLDKIDTQLVGYDFHQSSKQALEVAKEIAYKTDSEIIIVHADTPVSFSLLEKVSSNLLQKKKELLKELVQQLNQEGLSAFFELTQGKPDEVILNFQNKYKPDLTLIGKRRTSLLERLFLGDTAQKVVEKSELPVLVVRRVDEKED